MSVDDIRNGISSYIQSYGSADYIRMYEGMAVIRDIANVVVMLMMGILIVGLPLVLSIEVMYINFPTFQSGCDNLYGRLKGKPAKALGLVIRDAKKAVEESRTTRYGTSANLIYLEIKSKSIIFAAVIIALVMGAGNTIIPLATNIVRGVINAFSSLT